jgi:hypothetical protein
MSTPKWVFSNGSFQLAGKPQIPGDGKPVAPSGPAHTKVGGENILTWMQNKYTAIDEEYAKKLEQGIQIPETWIATQQGLINNIVTMYNQEVLLAGERTDAKIIADAKLAAAAADKADAGRGAANAETLRLKIAAEKKIADEEARTRGMAGTEAAAKSLEAAGATAEEKAMAAIKILYEGMDTQNAEALKGALAQLGVDIEAAKTNVNKAGADFISGYNPSKAYETAPVMQESVGANPLLDSLRSQGADTASVTAATDESNATLQQFAAFQKWANQNLNTGQQNFDAGMKNVSGQATSAGLQAISSRQPVIASGIKGDYAGYQNTINQGKAEAAAAAAAERAKAQAAADKARADGLITYGVPPKEGSAADNAAKVIKAPTEYANFKAALDAMHPNRPKQSLAKDKITFSKLFANFKKV